MAPELFQDGGVYSFYSDFWSLGCVLCELATGHPPFVATYFNELAKLILNVNLSTFYTIYILLILLMKFMMMYNKSTSFIIYNYFNIFAFFFNLYFCLIEFIFKLFFEFI